jgi:hypothetical protein
MRASTSIAVGLVLFALPAAAGPDAGVPLQATCGRPWRTSVSGLFALSADDAGAVLCAETQALEGEQVPLPMPCARVDFATGAFTQVAAPGAAVAQPTVNGVQVCVGAKCVALDVPADTSAFLERDGLSVELNGAGTRAAVPLTLEKAVGLFDAATGRRLMTLALPSACAAKAFFLGEALYVAAAPCDALEEPKSAWLFTGGKRLAAPALLTSPADLIQPAAVARLRDEVWVVASHTPTRLTALNVRTGARVWTTALPKLDFKEGDHPALGLTPYGTMPSSVSTLAVTPSGSVVAVSSVALALVDSKGAVTRVWKFPRCR